MPSTAARTTRAKFRVNWKDAGDTGSVVMSPVYSSDPGSENYSFWNATPSGDIRLNISNPKGFSIFENNKEYYVDFTPAE